MIPHNSKQGYLEESKTNKKTHQRYLTGHPELRGTCQWYSQPHSLFSTAQLSGPGKILLLALFQLTTASLGQHI